MRLDEILDKSYLQFMNTVADSAGPYGIMINPGRGNTWDSDDNKKFGPFDTLDEARELAEDYVKSNKDAWVIIYDKNENQVLGHVPWSKKDNKWTN